MTDDPEIIKSLWAVRSKYKKSDWYDAVRFDPSRDNLISMRDDARHNELRAKMAAGVSISSGLLCNSQSTPLSPK